MIGLIFGNIFLMLACTISAPVWATILNITVDDQYGDQVRTHAPLLFFCYFLKVRYANYNFYP
jgi:hypothetical protein